MGQPFSLYIDGYQKNRKIKTNTDLSSIVKSLWANMVCGDDGLELSDSESLLANPQNSRTKHSLCSSVGAKTQE